MHRGGEEKTLFFEHKLLEENGHKVILFTKDSRDISSYNLAKKIGLCINAIFSFDTYKKIKKIIKSEKPDIAHLQNIFPLISPSVYYALKKHNIPIVQTLHNYRLLCLNGLFVNNSGETCEKCMYGCFIHGILSKCYRRSFIQSLIMAISIYFHRKLGTFKNKVDLYISPSVFLKNKMIESGLHEDKIEVVSHCIDTDFLAPVLDYDTYGIYMGRLSKEKGVLTLVKAFQRIPDLRLKIVGEGPLHDEVDNFVMMNKLKNVELLGFIKGEERFEILKKALFTVIPSVCYENFPWVILESFALGVPVIASRIGGIFDLIDEMKNGILFNPDDVEDLTKKISILASDPRLMLSMRHNARQRAEEEYSLAAGYKRRMEIYGQLVPNG